jgi:hypothetical protein
LRPKIPPFLDLGRHITISSQPRTAQASPEHGSQAMATWTWNPRGLCGVRPVSSSKEQAVAQVGAT